jgi:hypothetical protein
MAILWTNSKIYQHKIGTYVLRMRTRFNSTCRKYTDENQGQSCNRASSGQCLSVIFGSVCKVVNFYSEIQKIYDLDLIEKLNLSYINI